ncbi:translation initiation factor IF-2-like [Onychostruthus taczanowskii]|uniref:translation initiation factor IF-2-like n=1 Tax=Onychostruthus taczanowskii TaxID=356909 RepID=UPI001B80CFBC|nr:translation initiation factor IF-2-like [Onychostruthus taczanowskii]
MGCTLYPRHSPVPARGLPPAPSLSSPGSPRGSPVPLVAQRCHPTPAARGHARPRPGTWPRGTGMPPVRGQGWHPAPPAPPGHRYRLPCQRPPSPAARHGTARHGTARHGTARHLGPPLVASRGVAAGAPHHPRAPRDPAPAAPRHGPGAGTARHGTARHGTARHGTARRTRAAGSTGDTAAAPGTSGGSPAPGGAAGVPQPGVSSRSPRPPHGSGDPPAAPGGGRAPAGRPVRRRPSAVGAAQALIRFQPTWSPNALKIVVVRTKPAAAPAAEQSRGAAAARPPPAARPFPRDGEGSPGPGDPAAAVTPPALAGVPRAPAAVGTRQGTPAKRLSRDKCRSMVVPKPPWP